MNGLPNDAYPSVAASVPCSLRTRPTASEETESLQPLADHSLFVASCAALTSFAKRATASCWKSNARFSSMRACGRSHAAMKFAAWSVHSMMRSGGVAR